MRLLVISDVHADVAGLERVLEHASKQGWDETLFLGDAIGYGKEAASAVALLRSLPLRAGLAGNHEAMLARLRAGDRLGASRGIVDALARNLEQLSREDLAFLDALEESHLGESWGAVHGALRERFEYLISVPVARASEPLMERDLYFVGHTHVPAAFLKDPGGPWRVRSFASSGGNVILPAGARAFLNPGSVSLARDGFSGNSYGVFDEDTREFTVFRLP